jgi:hypothetical protein
MVRCVERDASRQLRLGLDSLRRSRDIARFRGVIRASVRLDYWGFDQNV